MSQMIRVVVGGVEETTKCTPHTHCVLTDFELHACGPPPHGTHTHAHVPVHLGGLLQCALLGS